MNFKRAVIFVLLIPVSLILQAQTPAFPTAEGCGKYASGGRGGLVVEVTTLDDDPVNPPEGSLRWALKQGYEIKTDPILGDYKVYLPLTIVFRVSGIIDLKGHELKAKRNKLTIAGQTAPGDGICIKGESFNLGGSRNVIVRHLRFRTGAYTPDGQEVNAASVILENGGNFIFDHCSMSWSSEELCDFSDGGDITVQWCIFAEGLYASVNGKGARGYGPVIAGSGASYHHNLLAHNVSRSPRFGVSSEVDPHVLIDYVNNVNYNFGKKNSCYGGENRLGPRGTVKINMVNNYYKQGPAYPDNLTAVFVRPSHYGSVQDTFFTEWYLGGNFIEGETNAAINEDNYKGLDISEHQDYLPTITVDDLKSEHHPVSRPVPVETAHEAFQRVLTGAGAFPRDTVDRRVVREALTGTATFGGSHNNHAIDGIIDKPEDVGGWPEYNTYNPVTDNDHDGMDDAWEIANGLNPADPEDRNKIVKSGYTVLEVYLNSLVGENIELDYEISEPKVHDFVVAKDGTGDFASINEAIEAVPEDGKRHTIFIKKGVYEEKVFIGNRWQTSDKIISLIGENVDSVIIKWDDYHGKEITYPGKEGTIVADGMTAPTMTVTSPDFYMENITVINPSTAAQAEALYQSGDRQVLKNCKILGNQDTHRTKKGRRYFYFRSVIEGGVDFIYAGGTCYFYQCDIVSNRNGYITAPEDIPYFAQLSSGKYLRYGFFFKDCDILAAADVGTGGVFLGRPWGPECGSVFLNCRLGNHINSVGWQAWGGNESSASFAEYKSMNAEGTELVDVSGRVNWSMQLTADDVNKHMLLSKINSKISSNKFEPIPMLVAPRAPEKLTVNGNYLSWTPVDGAVGYVVYANGSVIGFNTLSHFADTLSHDSNPVYTVRAVGEIGNLSPENGQSEDFSLESITEAIDAPIISTGNNDMKVGNKYTSKIDNGMLWFDIAVDCTVYTLMGQKIAQEKDISKFNLKKLEKGVYIFRINDKNGSFAFKVMN